MQTFKVTLFTILLCLADNSLAQTSLWQVEKDGKQLYLGGTVHLLMKQDFPLPQAFEQAFNAADIVVLEANTQLMQQPVVAKKVQSAMHYQDGRQLTSVLTTDIAQQLEDYLQHNALPVNAFNTMTAGAVSMTITVMEMHKLGITESGVDVIYHRRAQQQNKPLLFLETLEQQIGFIASMGDGIEDELIASTLSDIHELPSYMRQMVKDWREGNVVSLEHTVLQDMREYPSVYQSLLLQRNQAWLPQIENMLQTDKVETVFVGVLHLIGDDGLIAQLRQRGYTVTQM